MAPEEPIVPIYLVDAYIEPVAVKITGRASYTNCSPLSEFFSSLIKNGKYNFVIDLGDCTGIDSTFLGMLAGIAMELRKEGTKGSLILKDVTDRNLEIIQNLGLHRIMSVNPEKVETDLKMSEKSKDILKSMNESSVASPKMILKAHENLVKTDQTNLNRFQDVLSFLRKQVKDQKPKEEE